MTRVDWSDAYLDDRIGALKTEIMSLFHEQNRRKIEKAPVKVGDLVTSSGPRLSGVWRVVEVTIMSWNLKPWVKAVTTRKDGTWGKAARHLFDEWDLVVIRTPSEAPPEASGEEAGR